MSPSSADSADHGMPPDAPETAAPETSSTAHLALEIVVVILALALGAGVVGYMMTHRPKTARAAVTTPALAVEVMLAAPADAPVLLRATGVVQAARETMLQAELSGRLIALAPELAPGRVVTAGTELARIDDRDWQAAAAELKATLSQNDAEILRLHAAIEQAEVAVVQRRSEVEQRDQEIARAEDDLKLVQAQADAARQEYELIRGTTPGVNQSLVLREPQLRSAASQVATARSARAAAAAATDSALAGVKSAQASLVSAEAARQATIVRQATADVNLTRTSVSAPYDALVTSRSVAEGANVGPGISLASLVAVDEFWVEVTVSVSELYRIRMPTEAQPGSLVELRADGWPTGVHREGRVLRSLGTVQEQGQMARILVQVLDPLGRQNGEPPLLLHAYVSATIHGDDLKGVVAIPEHAIHDGNQVLVADSDNHLVLRTVEVAWRDDQQVYLASGVQSGERIVVSSVAAPHAGMLLKINPPDAAAGAEVTP